MTEEFKKEGRVIIDGVNVLSCKYYLFRDKEGIASNRSCGIGLTACKGKNCDFKEIAHLKRENKEKIDIIEQIIKFKINQLKANCLYNDLTGIELSAKVVELEQENKELKEEIQFHNKENSNLLAERNAAQIGYDEIREVRERYRSALEEIRKIINGHASPSACEYWGSYKNACEPCALRILNQVEDKIQNKINEVLNDN